MKNLIFLLFILPIFCFGQAIPGCYNYVAQTPITAASNTTISGFSINCNGAATVGITIPAGVHDVHITRCKIFNSTTANGLIYISTGCYNITIDTCFLQSGWRGIYAVGATNNIHISNNYFYNIIDPNVTATTSPDGGGASVQLNACTGTSIQVLDNRSFHDVSGAGIGDQFSLYKCNGTAASPIRVCRNQALNGSTNPPNTGYAGVVGGDGGGSYQRIDSNIFVNVGAVGAQVQGGHDIEMSYNTIFIAQASYTSVGIAFGNYSGLASSNVTISYNNTRCIQPSGSVFNYWFDTKTAFSPTGWSTNTTSTGLNANILPNPLWSACNITVLAPNISYSPATYTFTMGVPITPFTPTNTGSIAAFTATLPAGLSINPSTGTISGTPTIGSPPADYTITAINTSGSSTASINIGVISTDASLATMTLSSGTLSPVFCGCISNYTVSVPNSTASITLTPIVNQANATVTVNGILVTSGSDSGAINLAAGADTIKAVVTAQNGSTNTYTVIVTRAPATDATLSALALSSGTFTPVFDSGIISYAASVDNSVAAVTLTPTVNQVNATVTVNGIPVSPGSASGPINLVVGTNIITTVVTAQDSVTNKTYTVTVTRPAATSMINFNPLANATYGDSPVFLSATSNNTDSGATITYTSDNPSVATVSGNTITIVGAGTVNITARQAATANFNAAPDVSQTLIVNKAELIIAANNQSKFYGGPFAFTGTEFTVQGLLKNDLVNSVILSSGGTDALANPGPYPITASAATGSGLSNYNISYVAGTLTVNGITLNFDPIPSKVYSTVDFDPGATSNTAITYTSSNANVATIVSGNIHIVGVGTSVITSISGGASQTQTLTVTPAPLTITANNVNKTYGSTLTDNNSSTAFIASGLQNGETIGNVTIAYNAGAATNDAVAFYTGSVIPSAATGGTFNPANYDIIYAPGDIIVGQATIDITAKDATKVYGDTQTFTGAEFRVTGLKGGDAIASVALTSDGAPATADVKSYDIIPSAAAGASGTDLSNYNIIYHNGTDLVSTSPLTITANNASKVYGITQSFQGTEFTVVGLQNNDHVDLVTLTSAGSPASAPVNNYPIIPSVAVARNGTNLANYDIQYENGNDAVGTTLLTITADDQSIAFGDTMPTLTVSYSGFVNGETAASLTNLPTVTTTATTGSPVGNYTINVSGAVDNNYAFSYVAGNLSINAIPFTFNSIPAKVYGAPDFDPGAVSSSPISYTSSNNLVATIVSGNIHIVGAGSTTITADDGTNQFSRTLTVIPAALSITANNQSKTYGAANPALTISYNGFVNSDTPAGLTTAPAIITTATANSGAGTYPITVSGAATANYTITYNAGTLSVGKAALSITADDQNKTYGSANPVLTASYSGFVNGDTPASLTTLPNATTPATTNSPVSTYPINISGAVDPNYNITYNAGTLTVGQAPLTITADDQSKTQGSVNPTLTVSYSGFVAGDAKASLSTQPTVTTTALTNSPIGTYPIIASGAADVNYTITYNAGTLTVGGIALSFAPIPSKVYGVADFNPGATSSSPITYTSSNPAVATMSGGNIHIVGAGTSTITADDGVGNISRVLTVTPADLIISVDNQSKIYGAGNPFLSVSYIGFVNGENEASLTTPPIVLTTAGTSSIVGSYPITASGATDANYNITYTPGTLTVSQAPLIITANNQSKTAGAANPALTVSYNGFVNGDSQASLSTSPTVTTTATTVSPSGTYPITASGAVGANYNISYVQGSLTVTGTALTFAPIPSETYGIADFNPGATSSSSITYTSSNTAVATISGGNIHIVGAGTSTIIANDGVSNLSQVLTVTPVALTITANSQSKTYGAANPALTVSYNGFVNGDTQANLTIAPSVTTSAVIGSAVGIYPITASGAASANYTIAYNAGTLTVGKAPLTITANNQSKAQGSVNPALTVNYSGFVNGDTQANLTTQPTITTTAVTNSPVGTYPITVSGAVAANYSISYIQGTLTVTGTALTFGPIPSKVYGTVDFNPGATSSLSITYTSSNLAVATIVNGNIHIVGAGTSTITANDGVGNLNQTLTVTRASLTITANNVNKTYGATLTGGTGSTAFVSTGLANGETIGSVTIAYGTGSAATAAVATYTGSVTPSAATGGTFTPANYTITYNSANIIVNKAALSITANNVTKTYGATLTGAAGSAAFTSTGLVNSQSIGSVTIAYGTGSAATASAGTYTGSVTLSAATGGSFTPANYTITYHAGNITVNKAALTITANNQTKVQGAANPALSVSYSGFVNGQTNSVLTTQPTVTTTAVTGSPVGSYPITASGAAAANYSFTYVAGTLTVTAANSLTFGPIPSKVYGTANFSPGATGTGTITYTSSNTAVATIVTGNIHIVGVGTSTIRASNGTTSLQQTLTVTPALLSITANNAAKTYGTLITTWVGAISFSSTGLVNSETIGSVTITYGTGAAAAAAVGTYTTSVVPSAATGGTFKAANYTIAYVAGTLTVNKATLTITASNVTKAYGTTITGGTGSKAFTTTGLQNGQTISSVTIAYGTGAAATANAGSYTGSVTPSAATGGTFIAADYTITYRSGTLTVNKVPLTITANNQTKIQGNANPTLTVSYAGFVNGQTSASLTTQPRITTTATTSSPVGTYPITASGAVATNYAINYVAGTLTINPSTAALISVSSVDRTNIAALAPEPVVKQAVSPNGDGINDVLTIENIEYYPENKVVLINGSGIPIYEIEGYDNVNKVFDGHSNITKAMQQPGTYFYMLEYKLKGEIKRKTSYFVIKY